MEVDLTAIVVTLLVSIVGIVLGGNYLKTREKGTKPLQKELKYWQEYSMELEDEVKHWKGKFNKKDAPPQFDGDLTKENLPDMIGEFFPMFSEFVPKYVQPFFKNPTLQKLMIDWFSKNPEKGAEIIGKFFGRKGGRPAKEAENTSGNAPNSTLPPAEIY